MPITVLTELAKQIIDDANFATLATLNADGSPQASIMWIARDGNDLLMSTCEGRLKLKNMRRDPRISMTVFDKDQPYAQIEVRGSVEIISEGGQELIDKMARKYLGTDFEWDKPGAVRVVLRLKPQTIVGSASI